MSFLKIFDEEVAEVQDERHTGSGTRKDAQCHRKESRLFQNIATEVQAKMKEGKDQMAATMEVMQKHQGELKRIMN